MKRISRSILSGIVKKTGIDVEKTDRIIGTLEINLARQAAKNIEHKYITLDNDSLPELEEALSIGADITPSEAKNILNEVGEKIKRQKDPTVKFLDKGAFEFKRGTLKFKLDE